MKNTFPIILLLIPSLLLSGCTGETTSSPDPTSTAAATPLEPTTPATSTETEPTEVTFPIPAPVILFFEHQAAEGLALDAGGDVDTEIVSVGNPEVIAYRSGNGRILPSSDGNAVQDWYMQFQVDDGVVYKGSPASGVQIEIEYLDEGTDQFAIEYDALDGGPYGDGRYKESDFVVKTNSGEFQTAVFLLPDAFFGNRVNGADFRLTDYSDGAETIRRVSVTLLDMETAQSPPQEIPAGRANLIFYNGVVLTMEGGSTLSAIALQQDRILDVGSDEAILAYAESDTTVVDLGGRTLMPGFIDAHSHIFNNPWRDDFEGGQELLLSNGITASAEMFVEEPLIQDLQAFEESGGLRIRISLYPIHVDNCGGIRGDWYAPQYPVSREPGALLQIPGVKLFNDGGSCNVPAVSYEYVGGKGSGDLYFGVEDLSEMILKAQKQGYQVAIHGLGDRAIDVNLDAIEAALDGDPNTYHHRIEHNTVLREDMLPRYTEVDPVAVIFGHFPTCAFIGDTSRYRYFPPEEYLRWEWPWGALIEANPGLHIAWHSDTPYSIGPYPLLHLESFVTRRQVQEDGTLCEPPAWAADDLLTVEKALSVMTLEGAYALRRENEIGSLLSGKLADLIILSANPLEVDPDSIHEIQVVMAMVGGNVEFCLPGQSQFCPGPP